MMTGPPLRKGKQMTHEPSPNQQKGKSVQEVETRLVGMFATLYASAIDAMCARYGPEALEVARQAFMDTMVGLSKQNLAHLEGRDLHTYVAWLTTDGTEQGHRYETIESTESSIRLKYLDCPWAVAFRVVGHPEIGRFFCDADAPIASAFNSEIQFERTMTLMDGDEYCNHHFYREP
jgi:L-2-amino-thiazoline-4-carboxylic acid hydrolase